MSPNRSYLRKAFHLNDRAAGARFVWRNLFVLVIATAFIYVFFEWLFIITKPSFMSLLGFPQKLEILLFMALLLNALIALPLAPFALLARIPALQKISGPAVMIGAFLPAFWLAALSLLLLDNFTYTIFKIGVVTSHNIIRGAYGVGFLVTWAAWWLYLSQKILNIHWSSVPTSLQKALLPGFVLAIFLPYPMAAVQISAYQNRSQTISGVLGNQPHILIITTDGLFASNMSLYGYERDTTPNLKNLAKSSFVAENAFTNSATTTGSLISIYTGKSPMRTRVLYPPDILQGEDAYQHLPGILKSQGYYTAQLSLPYYADAYKLNLLDGFDYANGREAGDLSSLTRLNRYIPIHYANSVNELIERLTNRLKHIFFIARMENPYNQVNSPEKKLDEEKKIRTTLRLLKTSDKPVFVHVHLMGTHGGTYEPEKQVFSAGQDIATQEPWNVDFYDDSILQFDAIVGMVVQELDQNGLLEKTVLVIGSDHGKHWDSLQRIPLLIRFPNKKYAGVIRSNAQNLDIAPTILDYLGLEKPAWMESTSLLKAGVAQRLIFAAQYTRVDVSSGQSSNQDPQNTPLGTPPFYQFGALSLIDCQKWRRLGLTDGAWETGDVLGHTAPCAENDMLSEKQAYQKMLDYLENNRFDVSVLKR